MWQVVVLFLFAAALAWLVAASSVLNARPPRDDEWAGWLADLRWERRRQAR